MSNFVALDNTTHALLKVKTQYNEDCGNNINQALVFPTEFQALQREYPIFFRKHEDNRFYAVVILGLDKDENLFLDSGRWNARYIPAIQMKGPFTLEIRSFNETLSEQAEPLVKINTNDPRVNDEDGENIFLPHGGYSPYFEGILQALRRIHIGSQTQNDFFEHLSSFKLIEPVTVEANFSETSRYLVPDLYTISKERMAELTPDELHKLNMLGLLEHCFAVLSSNGNMSKIVDMKTLKSKHLV